MATVPLTGDDFAMALPTAEIGTGTIVSVLASLVTMVIAWIGWARRSNADTAKAHSSHAKTLREVIAGMQATIKTMQTEQVALRELQVGQAREIATLTEKVRTLESLRDQLQSEVAMLRTLLTAEQTAHGATKDLLRDANEALLKATKQVDDCRDKLRIAEDRLNLLRESIGKGVPDVEPPVPGPDTEIG